jgi:hypothetical protein
MVEGCGPGFEESAARGIEAFGAFGPSAVRAVGVDAPTPGPFANGPHRCHPRLNRIEIAAPAPIVTTTTINSGAYHRREDIRRSS